RKSAKAGWIGGRVPSTLEQRIGEDLRIVPQLRAQYRELARIDARIRKCRDHIVDRLTAVRNEQRIGAARGLSHEPNRLTDLATVVGIMLERHDLPAATRHRLFELAFDDAAIGIARDQADE